MNFFPVGPLVRRAGVFFIRRSFKDDEVYKLVLRHYVDFLIEKRFPLEWYIEGGRSRSGKLLPPRFGLLAYVVDAYRRGRGDDVALVPVSISYDQISDVGDYAAEQRGGKKQAEGFAWFVGVLRRLGRPYGGVTLRFGEPLSLAKALGPPDPEADPDPDEQNLALQKLAFEVCVRINRVTPISPISLVCLAMLGRGDRALSKAETVEALRNLVASVKRRRLPTSAELDLETEAGVGQTLDELVLSGLLTRYDKGPEPVYAIGTGQHLAAAYYRNSVIHYFVNGAIAELSLLRAAEDDVEDRLREFWDEAYRLRDLLKFEFFFAEKDDFRAEMLREMTLVESGWEKRLESDGDEVRVLLTGIRPYNAHRILRPFLEAYRVVADGLSACPVDEPIDQAALLRDCLTRGRQYVLQRHVKSQESVSNVLFATAIKLARNRGLWEPGTADLALRRRAFAEEIGEVIRRVDGVESFVRARRAGVLP
jgi:glycerol-3-phosphate O-acyltransferase